MAEVRNNWEGQVINGVFPLRRFLGSSNHSSVFLTESSVDGFLNAAIKIVPADPERSQMQLWQWKTAATFSHPNLMRLLDSGQCVIDGGSFLFVVMEYAEESLSQILPYRALAPDEVRELLVPTLDALAFLHSDNWIQGQLKPSNFLVVDDQLKLAIDTIRPVGVSQVGPRRPTLYDPPESEVGNVSAASDIWALGVTITEALTQYPPTWLGGRSDPPTFPTNLPAEFAETVQQCLSADPARRPSVGELQVRTRPDDMPVPAAASAGSQRRSAPPPPPPKTRPSPPPAASVSAGGARSAAQAAQVRSQTAPPSASSQAPAGRPGAGSELPSVARLENAIPPPPASPPAIPEPEVSMRADPIRPDVGRFSELEGESKRGMLVPVLVAVVVIGIGALGWMMFFGGPSPSPSAVNGSAPTDQGATPGSGATSEAGSQVAAPQAADTQPPAPTNLPPIKSDTPTTAPPPPKKLARNNTVDAPTSSGDRAAVHEEIPNVSAASRYTIHGHVRVAVRVTVDSSGRVVRDVLDNPSPSNYFNRVAREAARKWRFASADQQGSREWLLRFEFGRDGTTVRAAGPRS